MWGLCDVLVPEDHTAADVINSVIYAKGKQSVLPPLGFYTPHPPDHSLKSIVKSPSIKSCRYPRSIISFPKTLVRRVEIIPSTERYRLSSRVLHLTRAFEISQQQELEADLVFFLF